MLLLFSHTVISDSLESVDCSTPGFHVLHHLLVQVMSIESVMPSNHLIICHPHLLLPSIFPSIRVFSNESDLWIKWQKFWSFSFNVSPSNEYSGLISFRIDWFDLLAVEGTLKSLVQHHSLKASNCAGEAPAIGANLTEWKWLLSSEQGQWAAKKDFF